MTSRLLQWYERNGRHDLPWRTTRDPYYTLVSEFMLQQTQVDRVVPKFLAFVELFPTITALAAASTADVLRAWRGLGYNSRAVRLKRVAETIVGRHGGAVPSETEALEALPGIGAYTAAAIRSFGFDLDDAPIDTNVRRVVHRLFAGVEHPPKASAAQLDVWARSLVPAGRAHDWNSALMDLGSSFCTARAPKCLLCPLVSQCSAAPIDPGALDAAKRVKKKREAVPFERTARYARGRIVDRLRDLPPGEAISLLELHRSLEPVLERTWLDRVGALVDALARDGVVVRRDDSIALGD